MTGYGKKGKGIYTETSICLFVCLTVHVSLRKKCFHFNLSFTKNKICKYFSCRIFRHLNTPSHSNLSARLLGLAKPGSDHGNETGGSGETFINSGSDLDDVTVSLIDETRTADKTQDTKL
jgi:hypothetical protein